MRSGAEIVKLIRVARHRHRVIFKEEMIGLIVRNGESRIAQRTFSHLDRLDAFGKIDDVFDYDIGLVAAVREGQISASGESAVTDGLHLRAHGEVLDTGVGKCLLADGDQR